jgi:hypothetical protein
MSKDTGDSKSSTSHRAWGGAFAAYGKIWKQIQKNPTPALVLIGIYVAAHLLSTVFQDGKAYMDATRWPYEDISYLVLMLPMFVYGLALADGKRVSVREIIHFKLKTYAFVLAAVLLYTLIVGVSLVLLVVPAIWTVALFFAAPYIVVDKKMGPVAALSESNRLTNGHKAKVWGLIGVSILLSIPVFVLAYVPAVGVAANMAFSILSTGACAVLYRWLQTAR